MQAIEWLWPGWIPKRYVTLIAGETGAGKGTMLADLVARETTGRPWPGEPDTAARQPGNVILLGSEDGTEDMTVPRLVACGANLTKIQEVQGVAEGNERTTFSLQDDIAAVRNWLLHARVQNSAYDLLVIDPVTSYLPGRKQRKVEFNDAGQLRSILEPWLAIAQEFDIAIICVTHFAKDTTRSMLHRVLGSGAFAQLCRSLCAVVHRPDDGMYARALLQVKTNMPEHPGGAWLFETERVEVGTDARNQRPIHATKPNWLRLDPSVTPESILGSASTGPVSRSEHAVGFAIWLKAQFFTTEQWLPSGELKALAMATTGITSKWWEENSKLYLDKQNINGVWMCRPKLEPE